MGRGDDEDELVTLAARVGEALRTRRCMLAIAESCTGGLVAATVTAVPGSSAWFERGFVTYSNAAKQEMLGVLPATLEAHGAVSEATVTEMAEGAMAVSGAQASIAVSGVAGPGGGSPSKPVGLVCLAWGMRGRRTGARCVRCDGDRAAVRRRAVVLALEGLLDMLAADSSGR